MDLYVFFGLLINLFVQLARKGQAHLEFYKVRGVIEIGESYARTALTGSFYKYPMVMLPFIERYNNLTGDESTAYKKLKVRNRILLVSILALIGFFVYVFLQYESI